MAERRRALAAPLVNADQEDVGRVTRYGLAARGAEFEGALERQLVGPMAGGPATGADFGERRHLGAAAVDNVGTPGMEAAAGRWVARVGTFSFELDRARRQVV